MPSALSSVSVPVPAADSAGNAGSGPVAVVDIGSNSVRLVVFDVYDRTLRPLFNEKVLCGLGRDLSSTGRLNADGVSLARESLQRFTELAEAMGVGRTDLLATAAVRDAEDGPDFVAEIERICGCPVKVLNGVEEGRLAATGVIAGLPAATGVVGDLGGGSLELVEVRDGEPGRSSTLPLGPFRLIELCGRDVSAMRREVDQQLACVDWIEEKAAESGQRVFFPVGGAWRNLARLHIALRDYPLHVIHGYRMRRADVEDIEGVIGRLGPSSLSGIKGITRRRQETLPAAAVVLARVLKALRCKNIVFSAYGLREGHVFEALPPEEQARDPLMAAAEEMAENGSRFGGMSDQLFAWTTPLFPKEEPAQQRLRRASCLLSDIAWREHADYRATQALQRILYFPFSGIDHGERVFLAYAAYTRYGGSDGTDEIDRFLTLLSNGAAGRARILGLAQRLAYQVSGATGAVLEQCALSFDRARKLTLRLPSKGVAATGGAVERRLQALGDALDAAEVIFEG